MLLKNAQIVLPDKIIHNGWLEIKQNRIVKIGSEENVDDGIDLKQHIIMPGFIDCHVHGGYGVDFEMATIDSFNQFAKMIAHEGVTKYCQATVTQPTEVVNAALSTYADWMTNYNHGAQARQIGAHIEGPFISPNRKGAHKLELLQLPNTELLANWIKLSKQNIKIVTYAPELADPAFTKFLLKNHILPSIGHSDATYAEFVELGYQAGARHVTHLFNGMSGVDQHRPGVATAALYFDDVLCELISDGTHIQPELVRLIYKIKGDNGICLITDAMCAKGMPDGPYKLGPLDVEKHGQKVCLAGTDKLAGSAATYDFCFRQFRKFNNVDYLVMAKVCASNIAKQLNIWQETGSIAVNKLADLTVLDNNDNVKMTICEGEIAFQDSI